MERSAAFWRGLKLLFGTKHMPDYIRELTVPFAAAEKSDDHDRMCSLLVAVEVCIPRRHDTLGVAKLHPIRDLKLSPNSWARTFGGRPDWVGR